MIKTFSKEDMLAIWKRRYGLSASPGLSGLNDLNALDRLLLQEIDLWYDKLLLTAPPELLPREDIADEATPLWLTSNCAEIEFPPRGVRLLRLKMEGWERDVSRFVEPGSVEASMQNLMWARATPERPVAVLFGERVEVHGFENPGRTPVVLRLEMVVRPTDGSYILDTSLLPAKK